MNSGRNLIYSLSFYQGAPIPILQVRKQAHKSSANCPKSHILSSGQDNAATGSILQSTPWCGPTPPLGGAGGQQCPKAKELIIRKRC